MKDFCFLFPGQGAQTVGMGKDLYEKSDFAKKAFVLADEVLGYKLSDICFNGPQEELNKTQNTQPALLTVSYILYNLLNKEPMISAGHSLGEYSALVCAGAFSFEDAVSLVYKRGTYMQEAVPEGKGSMVALIGADVEKIKEVLEKSEGIVGIANWNSAAQVVISGDKEAVENAVKEIGAPKSVPLAVSAPFHSKMMMPAQERLSVDIDKIDFKPLNYPIVNNVDVKEMINPEEIKESLKRQVSSPVLWHKTVLYLLQEKECRSFCEIGTGNVLRGILKRTAREFDIKPQITGYSTFEDLS